MQRLPRRRGGRPRRDHRRLGPGASAEELVAAADVIEDAGFTTVDDLVHGGGKATCRRCSVRAAGPSAPRPDAALEAGIDPGDPAQRRRDPDGRLGVQTGELLLVTQARRRAAAHLPDRPGAGGMSGGSADVVVIGAGHDCLIGAAYLAVAGLKVVVLEERPVVGGNTVTEELTLPGSCTTRAPARTSCIQSNPVIRDDELGLAELGLRYVHTDPAVVLPFADGDALAMHRDVAERRRDGPVDARGRRGVSAAARGLARRAGRGARPVERRPARSGRQAPTPRRDARGLAAPTTSPPSRSRQVRRATC